MVYGWSFIGKDAAEAAAAEIARRFDLEVTVEIDINDLWSVEVDLWVWDARLIESVERFLSATYTVGSTDHAFGGRSIL